MSINKEDLSKFDNQYNRDSLTGLPDRDSFFQLGQSLFSQLKETSSKAAILAIEFDSVRHVAQNLGYIEAGSVLKQVGERLQKIIPQNGRLGKTHPEFAILIWDLVDEKEALILGKKIISSLSKPFFVNHHKFYLYCNIGVCVHPDEHMYTKDFNEIIRQVESALPRESDGFRNKVRMFTASISEKIKREEKIDSEIRNAIQNNELSVYYQPRVVLISGEITGAEALLRWKSPALGEVDPNEFIPVLERTGHIHEITEWVLKEACSEALWWKENLGSELVISVNFSPHSFDTTNLPEIVHGILDETGLPPEILEVEITESLLLQDFNKVKTTLSQFNEMGIKISLDDFGTGYSSLNYLTQLPLNSIKIDRSFVTGLPDSNISNSIARTIATLSKSLGFRSIAEGMENHDQVISLKVLDYDIGQGFYFSKPLSAKDFRALLGLKKTLP